MEPAYLLVVAAFGMATRALGLTGYGAKPKALINVGRNGVPVLEEILREAIRSGIREGVVVTGPGHYRDLIERFLNPLETNPLLDEYLHRRKKQEELRQIQERPRLDRLHVVTQQVPNGFGVAVSLAAPYLQAGDQAGRPFVGACVALGDDLVHSRTPAMAQLIAVHQETGATVVGVQRVSRETASRFGLVVVDPEPLTVQNTSGWRAYRVRAMEEKPQDPIPSLLEGEEVYFAVIGRYLVRPEDMEFLVAGSGSVEQEFNFTELLQRRAAEGTLVAVEVAGHWHSVGTALEAQQAFLRYALIPEEGSPTPEQRRLREYVQELLKEAEER
ncbi:MAG: UTP--glucose-1-phosphate uridylyltransferase [Candidatus Poribacteria bacterium]|nr:MAG: UTP--glucose-1-phosphate uridylyltransferase [Candidatus Poribacteria bacterium]